MTILGITANIFGYIGLAMLYWQVVFGSRHVFKYFTRNTVLINKYHSMVGKYAIVFVLLHPLLMLFVWMAEYTWLFSFNFENEIESHISLGRMSLILFLVVWITSALVRSKIKWRPWKWVHLLAYPIVFFTLMHMKDLGTWYNRYEAIQFLWAFAVCLFFAAIFVRICIWSGLLKTKYSLESKKLVGNDLLVIRLKPRTLKHTSHVGQHFFLQTKKFGSEHPFSVVKNEDGTLTFGMRRVGKFFDEINSKEIGETIYVDGPYGVFTKEGHNEDKKVIISGGIGVTPFVDFAKIYGKNSIYINCNRNITEALWRDEIRASVERYVDIVDSYDGQGDSSILVGRINKDILGQIVGDEMKTSTYFVCGSPMFIKIVREILAELGVSKRDVYFEKLGF
jgi:predicted ferric reductase